jgi:iron complex transport system ATP-binding protein
LLSLKNISIALGKRLLFDAGSLYLANGLIALVGRNGAGKSTLFQALLQSTPLATGVVELNGKNLSLISKSELARTIAVVFTKPEVYGDHKVQDILILGRVPHQGFFGKTSTSDVEIVYKIASKLGITAFLERRFSTLSDGEKQLIMIGRAFVQDTPIILLDEPAAFLDVVNRIELIKILKELAKSENKLIIFSTHHIDQIESNCDAVLLIHDGKLSLIDNQSEFLPVINSAFNLDQ